MESLIDELRKAARESFVYSDLLREAADAITELVHSCDVLDEQVTAGRKNMSVLVKGREMPANCQECMCLNDEYFFCQAVGRKPKDQNFFEERPDWCPLIEIHDEKEEVKHEHSD